MKSKALQATINVSVVFALGCLLVSCGSKEPMPVKRVFHVNEISNDVISHFETLSFIDESPTDPLDPHYVRWQHYKLLEKQVSQLFSNLFITLKTDLQPKTDLGVIKFSLATTKGYIKDATFLRRGKHIVNEFTLQTWRQNNSYNDLFASSHIKRPDDVNEQNMQIIIKPMLYQKDDKLWLQLSAVDSSSKKELGSVASIIDDYYFYYYLDGIKQSHRHQRHR